MNALDNFRGLFGVEDKAGIVPIRKAGRLHLCELFAALEYTQGAEIGVWQGAFAKALCEAVPKLHLRCVDPWHTYTGYDDKKNDNRRLHEAHEIAVKTLTPFDCEIMRMESLYAADQVPNDSLDFIYVDANHAEYAVRADLKAWVPKVRSGGIVAGHDYVLTKPKPHIHVKPAVDTFVAERGIETVYILAADKSPSFFWVQP